MGMELVGRAGDLASFKNISLDVANNGLAAIFTGQAQSLKKFGIVMTEANLEAYALANGFTKTYKEMTQAEQVMLRYQYVMEMTKNSAGDFANTSDGAANSTRVLQETLKETAAELGQELIPLVVPLIQNVTELVKGVNSLDEGTKSMIVNGLVLAAVAAPILKIGGAIISGIGWLIGTGIPALTTGAATAGAAGVSAAGAVATGVSVATTATFGLIAALGAAVVAAELVIAKLMEEQRLRKNIEAKSAATKGRKQVSADMVQYYNPSDYIAYGYGDSTEYWLKNGAQMTKTGKTDYYDRMREEWSSDTTVNQYNMTINSANISELQDLIDMADSAQILNRMGVSY